MKNYEQAKIRLASVRLGRCAFYNAETNRYCFFGALSKPNNSECYAGWVGAFIEREYDINRHLSNRIMELFDHCHPDQLRPWANKVLDALKDCKDTFNASKEYQEQFIQVCSQHPNLNSGQIRDKYHEGLTNLLIDCIKSN